MKHLYIRYLTLTLYVLSLFFSLPVLAIGENGYTLSVVAKPSIAGSFNTNNAILQKDETIHLYAYSNSNFTFKEWQDAEGNTIALTQDFVYTMPGKNVTLTAQYEYNPANPENPAKNSWDATSGVAIVDDFPAGSLAGAISTAIKGSKNTELLSLIVAGRMTNNDYNVINTYTNCTILDLSRVSGTAEVPSYAFDYTKLESVYLPSTIEKIGSRAFYDCKQLTSLTLYATVPPTLESNVFAGVQDGLVVYVPAAAISQYQDAEGWKNFVILPIQEDIRSISISLPEGANASDYAQMWLELTNTKSGQRMHYVMTDRQTYTFANIIRNTSWNVTLRNERGDVFGQIENVEVKDEDVTVTFASLSKPQNVSLSVLTPDGYDVTNQVQVTWTDAQGNYVAQGASLFGLPVGYQVNYRMALSQELAMTYDTPSAIEYTLKDGSNALTSQLQAIKKLTISGKVKDASTGLPLSGTVISASQTFGGKYSKTVSTKTDAKGNYVLTVSNVPTSLAVSASDYISQTIVCDSLMTGEDVVTISDVSLKGISGAVITLGLTYSKCPSENGNEETFQEWYADYNNVAYSIFNKTKQKSINQFNVQYPQIVLLEEVDEGDVLEMTATSRTSSFMPVHTTATIDAEQRANALFDIVELGKIQASFANNANAAVVGTLYDDKGKYVKSYDYRNASLTISGLPDGTYTLVSMGSSRFFNTIYDLSSLSQTGLAMGTDYVQNTVEVKSGTISVVNIGEIPTLDESKLYYTGDNTSFTFNKSSIVVGNYLTLTGHLDFKSAYSSKVSNVTLIVDLPESCSFVENSVMVGNSTSIYTIEGKRVIIPVANYTDCVRFCIIPTVGGEYSPSAFVKFSVDGETVTQPIGSANYTAKDLSISVPLTVAKATIPVSGTAIGASSVEIYDNDVLIGQTTSLANGTWATTCDLNEPYNLSHHQIYAKVLTKTGMKLKSEIVDCSYDKNAISIKTVQMSFFNGWLHKDVSIVFDFEKGTTSESSYMFYTSTDITFVADLTNNDTTVVSGVTLYVHTDRNEIRELSATYDEKSGKWVAVSHFDSYNLPINVSASIYANKVAYADRCLFNLLANRVDEKEEITKEQLEAVIELNKAADAIDQQMDADKAAFAKLEGQMDAANDNAEMDVLLVQWLTQAGLQSSVKDFAVDIPETIDEEYIKSLTTKFLELVDNSNDIDNTSTIEELLKRSEDGLNDVNEHFDYFASLETVLSDTITVNTKNGETTLLRTTLEKYGEISFDVADTIRLEMTDDNTVYVYISTDNELLIVDSLNNQVWYIQDQQTVREIANAHSHRAKGDFVAAMNVARQNLEWLGNTVLTFVKELIREQEAKMVDTRGLLNEIKRQQVVLIGENAGRQIRINEIEKEIKALISLDNSMDDFFKVVDRDEMISKLKFERTQALKKIETNRAIIKTLEKSLSKYTAKIVAINAVLGELHDLYMVGMGIFNTYTYVTTAIQDHRHWHSLIDNILPCESDYAKALNLRKKCESDWSDIAWSKGYYPAFTITAITTFVNGCLMANKAAKLVAKMLISTITDFLSNTAEAMFNRARSASLSWYPIRYAEYRSLKCKNGKDPNDDSEPNKPSDLDDSKLPLLPPVEPIHDPSGYVYESVSSNRIEGVTATVYYKEMVENMYGDLHENIVKWDAEEYAQENPLFTDANGYYRWDVPQGLWQVKFEKEGYETTYSEWLPVPPPQLDVNIAMKQNVQPNVKNARAYEDAVEVEFDKYMMPEFLITDNIIVMAGEKQVEGTIELLNEEVKYEGETETFASKVRFNANAPFEGTEVTLMVNNRVKSYAGIRMQDNYSQSFIIEQEIRKIVCDSSTVVGYGHSGVIPVTVLPASASAGKVLNVSSSSSMILTTDVTNIKLDENGSASIPVVGELPGTAALTFFIDGYDISATTIVNVEQIENVEIEAPKANIASGTTVTKGTTITLSCTTKDATIYYTLDGSCPCEETTRLTYTEPIVINETVTIKAMAVTPDMTESDIVEFTYIVDEEVGIDEVTLDTELKIYPLPVRDKLNVTAGGKIIKSVKLTSMSSSTVVKATKPVTIVTLDVSSLTPGIYIINIATEDKTYSRKIMKVE